MEGACDMIKKLEVTGYRLLDEFEADFGDITVVIGANATGKSTLIDCLQFISQSTESPLNDVLRRRRGIASVASAYADTKAVGWKLTFVKPSAPHVLSTWPFAQHDRFIYEVKLDQDALGEAKVLYEVLRRAEPGAGADEALKFLESRGGRSVIFDPGEGRLVDFDTAPAVPEQWEPSKGGLLPDPERAEKVSQAAAEHPSLLLQKMRFFNEYPYPSMIRIMLAMCSFYHGFDVGRSAPVRVKPAEILRQTTLYETGENLGTVMHEILTRHDYLGAAEEINDFLRVAYQSFEWINAETAYGVQGKVIVRWGEKDARRPMELWDLSDGVLRFLCLAAALLNPEPPPFIGIDEPEAGLHPRLLPIVADMIKTASERTQVLVTTHSPDLLSCFDLDDIAVMSREESRIEWRRPGNRKSLHKMLKAVGGDTLADLHRSGELEAME